MEPNENKKETATAKKPSIVVRLAKNRTAQVIGVIILIILIVVGGIVAKTLGSRVYTDQADIEAPVITLSPTAPGVLQKIFVNVGDYVAADTVVAQVGDQMIQTQVAGIITSTEDSIGQNVGTTDAIVTMVDPTTLRAVAHLDEDKGLSSVAVGDHVVFTVDAFGSKQFQGVVDEISPTARVGDVVFNISDARETQEFDVKIRYDVNAYPQISNGMSAKVWIYTNTN
jgi:multidrug resistance efflux pump